MSLRIHAESETADDETASANSAPATAPSDAHPGLPAEGPRGRAGSPKQVSLPEGWLIGREIDDVSAAMIKAAELSVSGG